MIDKQNSPTQLEVNSLIEYFQNDVGLNIESIIRKEVNKKYKKYTELNHQFDLTIKYDELKFLNKTWLQVYGMTNVNNKNIKKLEYDILYNLVREMKFKHKDEYKNLSIKQMTKIILIHEICEHMVKKFHKPMMLDGLTGNPPPEALETFGHKGKDRRNHYTNRVRLKYNRYKPFLNVDKKFVADIYKQNNIMDLFEITRSCTGTAKDTDNYTRECHKCFWCYERKWAFDLVW